MIEQLSVRPLLRLLLLVVLSIAGGNGGLAAPGDAKNCKLSDRQLQDIYNARVQWLNTQNQNKCSVMSDVSERLNADNRCGSVAATATSDIANVKTYQEITKKALGGKDNDCPLILVPGKPDKK